MDFKRKHIVFILSDYHPTNSANGMCAKKVIYELEKYHDITVVCLRKQKYLPTNEKLGLHEIIRVETIEHYLRNYIYYKQKLTRNKMRKNLLSISLFFIKLVKYLKAIVSRKNINTSLVKKYINALKSIDKQIDIIIPVCFPFESLLGAVEYKRQFNNSVKVIPYIFDKFSESNTLHRTEWNKKLKMKAHLSLEKTVILYSDNIIVTGSLKSNMLQNHNEFSDKFIYTDIPALSKIKNDFSLQFPSNKVNLVFTGGLNNKNRSPLYTLKMIESCINERSEIAFHLFIRGDSEYIVNKYVKEYPKNIINHGSVPVNIAHSAISSSDFLISIGNVDISQIPSKIFEYISSGKPIIHFYVDENDPVIDILKKYPISCCLKQSDEDFVLNKNVLMEFIKKYRNVSPVSFEEIKKHYKEADPKYTAEIISGFL